MRDDKLKEIEDNNYHDLHREHPFQVKEHTIRFFSKLLEDSDTIFDGVAYETLRNIGVLLREFV